MSKKAIEVNNLSIKYRVFNNYNIHTSFFKRKGKKELFEAVKSISFSVDEGKILGIIGKNGSGKSTLLNAIAGIFQPDGGSIDLKNHSVSLLSIGVGFKRESTGRENIILSGMLLGFTNKQIQEKMDKIIEFSELGDAIDKPVKTYSSGMHSKLAFAITSHLETDIILIDEVLSVGDERFKKKSYAKMKELISDKERTVLIVSHNIQTLRELCDEVLWMHDGIIKEIGEANSVLNHYVEFMK